MAEHILPEHKPHDQLRTEAPKQRAHTDKYVSAFVTGASSAELTFQNPILDRSADHFKVGIDDLTVNLGSLSMLDYSDPTEVLFRIQRRGVTHHPVTNADERSNAVPSWQRHFLMPDYVLAGSQAENDLTAAEQQLAAATAATQAVTQANLDIVAATAAAAQAQADITQAGLAGDAIALAQAQADQAAAQAALQAAQASLAANLPVAATGPPAVQLIETFYKPGSQRARFRDGFEFKVDRVFVSLVEIMQRFNEVASGVNAYIEQFGLNNLDPNSAGYVIWNSDANGNYFAAGQHHDFIQIGLTGNGQLSIAASRVFWMNFVIVVPLEKYRQILFKDPDLGEVTLHPGTGALEPGYPIVQGAPLPFVFGAIPLHDWDRNIADAHLRSLTYIGAGNLFSTIDRRVTLEVGCSLPIKNSPLIDHGVEAPDYVLGRFMFHKPYTLGVADYSQESLGVQTIQGARDRVVFHHLRPQQKIQALRLRLWVRVRKYDLSSHTWGMQTIVCPIDPQDYWHIRLQFVSKS